MPIAKVNNINLYYEIRGTGQPIVFVNAFTSRHSIYFAIAEHFAKTHQVVLFDNRGSGQSDCPDVPYTIEMMANDLAELCQLLQLPPAHYFGLSMGGAIVQVLAHNRPELVRSAILCNSFMKLDIRYALCAEGQLALLQTGAPRKALIQQILGWIFSSAFLDNPGVVDSLIELQLNDPYPISEIGFRNQLHALIAFDSTPWIQQIKVPTAVLGSDKDMIVAEEHMREMAQLIPGAVYHHFAGSGHLPIVEQPERLLEVVSQFILKD